MTALLIDKNQVPEWWTHEHGDLAATMLSAALAEAGYPVSVEPDVLANPKFENVPTAIANRARSLVFLRMGIQFGWCDACPDRFTTFDKHAKSCSAHVA